MLDRLLESRGKRHRSTGGAIVSVGAHTALIAAAVYATGQARNLPAPIEAPRPVYYSLPKESSRPTNPKAPSTSAVRSKDRPILRFFDVPTIDVKVPSINMSDATTSTNDFAASRTLRDESSGSVNGEPVSGEPLRADQVERQVALRSGSVPPVYPVALRDAGIEGEVLAVFVVDEDGRAEDSTVKFLRSDNALFEDAVKVALKRMRFVAAEVGGRKVRQLVQMPFVFTLRK
jgi:periplasmic protein TonB